MRQVRENARAEAGAGARAEGSSCFWLAEKEGGEEVEKQAVTLQEMESETVAESQQEPSEDLEEFGFSMTWGKCEMKGLDHIGTSDFFSPGPFSKGFSMHKSKMTGKDTAARSSRKTDGDSQHITDNTLCQASPISFYFLLYFKNPHPRHFSY